MARQARRIRSEEHVQQKLGGDVVEERTGSPSATVNEVGRVVRGGVGYVRIEGGVTQNMGDYSSVRVTVGAELPCDPDILSLDATADRLSEFVDARLRKELAAATGEDDSPEEGSWTT